MKRYTILTTAALTLLGWMLPGCTKQAPAERPRGPVIRLGAGLAENGTAPGPQGMLNAAHLTRGLINTGDLFEAAAAGWEATAGTEPDYTANSAWLSAFTAAAGTAQPVTLIPERYYNADPAVNTHILAWYPAGSLGPDGRVTFADMPDGDTDVMLAAGVSGSSQNMQEKKLEFRHLLSQLRFRIKVASELTWKPILTSITVRDVELPSGIDLSAGAVSRRAAADFIVRGIEPGRIAFTPAAQDAGVPLLACPPGGNTLTVGIVSSLGMHQDITATIDGDAQFVPGKAYAITLTYTGNGLQPLEATVSVAPWQDVPGGDTELPI